jgi:hypothetical protein
VNVRKTCLLRSLGQAFYSTAQELLHDNGDAFRAARRQSPLPGRQAPRIVHARRFWNALSDVATYWDTSLDSYSDNDSDKKGNDAMDIDQLRTEAQHDNKMDLDNKSSDEKKSEDNPNKTKTTYTGRRTDTGRNMYVFAHLFHCSSFVFYTEFDDTSQLQGLFSPPAVMHKYVSSLATPFLVKRMLTPTPVTGLANTAKTWSLHLSRCSHGHLVAG